MDSARAAVAAAGGAAGPGTVDFPEFKVKSVRPVSGGCPPRPEPAGYQKGGKERGLFRGV